MTDFVDTADGVRLAFDSAGSGDPGMVLVHGWCCDRSYVAPQFTHFAAGHSVVALDLRGHGESSRPDPATGRYDVAAFADDVLAVARAAGLSRPVVVGHSLGGLVALACAARPADVCAAVLIDPALILNPDSQAFFDRSGADVAADEDGAWRTRFVTRLFRPTDTVRREETIAGMATALPPAVAAAGWQAMASFDGPAALRAAQVPVLRIGSDAAEPGLRANCPSVEIGRTVGAGHFLHLEVPEQVDPMIERFLAVNDL